MPDLLFQYPIPVFGWKYVICYVIDFFFFFEKKNYKVKKKACFV